MIYSGLIILQKKGILRKFLLWKGFFQEYVTRSNMSFEICKLHPVVAASRSKTLTILLIGWTDSAFPKFGCVSEAGKDGR